MTDSTPQQPERDDARLRDHVAALESEVEHLRQRLAGSPQQSRRVEQQLIETQRQLAALST
ncbi:hypothetical protein, partial [Methylobacter sp. BlB1]|uniref:hypothetical protein n=1 Tax=Methylobacter sp. BlB1 TaxID=2785914 RepID=UPI0018963D12